MSDMHHVCAPAHKEFVLQYSAVRWKINSRRRLGGVALNALIEDVAPQSVEAWRKYVLTMCLSENDIHKLGEHMYQKIKSVLPYEERFHPALLASITEEDCTEYVRELFIDRTYKGYVKRHKQGA